ncbi:hypothetical protein BaRGS_00023626 [Batillaria attramentaria]|uniref:Uncharacterized protein n=1 Tax=Batillaria attramentaria TaxID=370345 RepID=A0ABD0KDC0_9CAEN
MGSKRKKIDQSNIQQFPCTDMQEKLVKVAGPDEVCMLQRVPDIATLVTVQKKSCKQAATAEARLAAGCLKINGDRPA